MDIRSPVASTAKQHAKVSVLRGSFQSWKYFHKYKPLLDYQFVLKEDIYDQAAKKLFAGLEAKKDVDVLIGISVFRKMALEPGLASPGYSATNKRYFLRAIARMSAMYPGAMLFAVSDDVSWCRTAFEGVANIVFVESMDPVVTLAMLMLADHLILSVGSLGWWGAYQGDALDVVYYNHWARPHSAIARNYRENDYFLPHWTGLD
ncbi:hypothetical protein RvY_02100 [Ramazzottius varieornatus]|uniref:L-Fucosyltransferase n=1 Tax=Ramazzottius varieornatus TaxID=947166 RepID=A0A1D1UT69_RAMVA|nr:hypothetical protein RvY_02100 [Ramazzottius varieornatus]